MRVRWDAGQLHIAAHPCGNRAHHAFVPRWHFDMVLDEQVRPDEGQPVIIMTLVLQPQHGWPAYHAPCPHPLHVQATHYVLIRAGVRRQRNQAYDSAIRAAVAYRRGTGAQRITALDIGAGSGLLSMMALRCAVTALCTMPALQLQEEPTEASEQVTSASAAYIA